MIIKMLVLVFSLPVISSCGWFVTSEYAVRLNAVWAHDDSAVLSMESRYLASSAAMPYWHPDTEHIETVLFVSEGGLKNPVEILSISDPDEISDGRLQTVRLYWHRGNGVGYGRLFYVDGNDAVAINLDTGERAALRLPDAVEADLFWTVPGIKHSPGEHVPAMDVLPSPDGTLTAVFYTLAVNGAGGDFDLDFYHAIAYFDDNLKFVAAYRTGSRYKEETFTLFFPGYAPPVETLDPPSLPSGYAVPSATRSYFLWKNDSSGVYLATGITDTEERDGIFIAFTPDAEEKIEWTEVTEIPEIPLPAPAGAVSSAGRLLALRGTPGDDNSFRLFIHQLENWIPYGSIGLVAVEDAMYLY